MNRRIRIQQHAPRDRDLWKKLYYRHQEQRLRRRLLALKALWDGATLADVCRTQNVARPTLERWIDAYLHGGFDRLLAPEHRAVPQALSATRRRILRYVVLHKTPAEYGLEQYQWTAPLIRQWLEQKWQIHLGEGRIYQLLDELGLSHQRAHRDYQPAQPAQQAAFVQELKKKQLNAQQTAL